MKQHILRLLIVLILAVGIGFVIYFLKRDNTPFVPTTFIASYINEDEDLKDNLSALSSKANSKFEEDVVIYNIYEDTLEYYSSLLVNINFNKKEASTVKNLYKEYRNKVDDLIFSTNSLLEYLDLENQNATELSGRKEKVNTDFNALNKSYYKVVTFFENAVNDRVYNGKNYNTLGVLKSNLIILTNSYNENRNNFSFLSDVNAKINDFVENNCNSSDSAIRYVIKFNQIDRQTLLNSFNTYFVNGTTNDDLNILLNFLNSEVYYEEV